MQGAGVPLYIRPMSYKDQGNAEYKKGNWLKAAALYTKGIKEDPENAVLYSNRSAALLQLKKSGKALEDAEECIKRDPFWDKGFYRKGLALELAGRCSEALEAVERALACNPDNAEMRRKARDLRRKVEGGNSKAKADKENQSSEQTNAPPNPAPQTQDRQPFRVSQPLGAAGSDDEEALEFERDCIVRAVAPEAKAEPSVYFLGERAPHENVEDATSQVKIKEAFATPDNLQNCLGFLRSYAADRKARASCAVVSAQQIAYPQVWKKPGWPLGSNPQGMFVQLETRGSTKVYFLPEGAVKDGKVDAHVLGDDFRILERLLQ